MFSDGSVFESYVCVESNVRMREQQMPHARSGTYMGEQLQSCERVSVLLYVEIGPHDEGRIVLQDLLFCGLIVRFTLEEQAHQLQEWDGTGPEVRELLDAHY